MSKVKTHEQWEVAVQKKCFGNEWCNAVMWYSKAKAGQRYVKTEAEAREVLNEAYELWNGKKFYNENGERYETQQVGLIGISTVHTRKTDEEHMITKHRLRKRIVTEWEIVEED